MLTVYLRVPKTFEPSPVQVSFRRSDALDELENALDSIQARFLAVSPEVVR